MSNNTTTANNTPEATNPQQENFYDTFDLVIAAVKGFSAVWLALLIFIYWRRKEFKTISGKNVISFAGCLFISHIIDVLNILLDGMIPRIPCLMMSVLTNFLLFASFLWVSVMAFDIMHAITGMKASSSTQGSSSRYIKYSIFVWLVALAIWLPAVFIDLYKLFPEALRPRFADPFCDINNRWGIAIFFDGPAAVTVLANLIMLLITTRAIIQIKRLTAQVDIKQDKQRFVLYVKLAVVMGVIRFAMFLEWFFQSKTYLYITAIPDCLFGFFIFLNFAFKSPSWKKVKKCLIPSCCFAKGWFSEISASEGLSDSTVTTVSSSL